MCYMRFSASFGYYLLSEGGFRRIHCIALDGQFSSHHSSAEGRMTGKQFVPHGLWHDHAPEPKNEIIKDCERLIKKK